MLLPSVSCIILLAEVKLLEEFFFNLPAFGKLLDKLTIMVLDRST